MHGMKLIFISFTVVRSLLSRFKCAKIRFRPGLRPGPCWGSSRRSPRPPSRLGRGIPLPIPLPLDAEVSRSRRLGDYALISPQCLEHVDAAGCSHTVRNLGVIYLTQNYAWSHISCSKTASARFFHLRRLRQLWGVVTDEVMKYLMTSLVLAD